MNYYYDAKYPSYMNPRPHMIPIASYPDSNNRFPFYHQQHQQPPHLAISACPPPPPPIHPIHPPLIDRFLPLGPAPPYPPPPYYNPHPDAAGFYHQSSTPDYSRIPHYPQEHPFAIQAYNINVNHLESTSQASQAAASHSPPPNDEDSLPSVKQKPINSTKKKSATTKKLAKKQHRLKPVTSASAEQDPSYVNEQASSPPQVTAAAITQSPDSSPTACTYTSEKHDEGSSIADALQKSRDEAEDVINFVDGSVKEELRTACEVCTKRKIKCVKNEEGPCKFCLERGKACYFTHQRKRGRPAVELVINTDSPLYSTRSQVRERERERQKRMKMENISGENNENDTIGESAAPASLIGDELTSST